MKIRRPVRLALIVAGLAGGWWAGALLGEHYNAPPSAGAGGGRPAAVHGPTSGPAAKTTTARPVAPGAARVN